MLLQGVVKLVRLAVQWFIPLRVVDTDRYLLHSSYGIPCLCSTGYMPDCCLITTISPQMDQYGGFTLIGRNKISHFIHFMSYWSQMQCKPTINRRSTNLLIHMIVKKTLAPKTYRGSEPRYGIRIRVY